MSEPYKYVRDNYGVPAETGRRVVVDGKPGVIAEPRGAHIGVLFDHLKPTCVLPCHPTWRVEYQGMGEVRQPTRSQKRYLRFLDEDGGLRFGEWLRSLKHEVRSHG